MSDTQRTLLARGLAVLAAVIVAAPAPPATAEDFVRVKVASETPAVRVTVPGPCSLVALSGAKVNTSLPELRWQEILPDSEGLRVGRMAFRTDQLRIVPRESPVLYLNGARYRGSLTIVRQGTHRLLVINRMPLEEYLKGVVPREVDYRWPMETLKAQAIVARTFTLRQLADRAGQHFDVTTTWPQLYGGILAERSRAVQAVEATSGLVLASRGRPILAYYHTVCGGRTEDAPEVWPTVTEEPLQSVACTHCRRAPHYRWHLVLTAEELSRAVSAGGVDVGSIESVVLGEHNRSGRVRTMTVTGPRGSATLAAIQLRTTLGPNRLRSTKFVMSQDGGTWVFRGDGWGHGVGLCQWGARLQAEKGRSSEQILKFYFPGAILSVVDR